MGILLKGKWVHFLMSGGSVRNGEHNDEQSAVL
jgi:hypothetical protein